MKVNVIDDYNAKIALAQQDLTFPACLTTDSGPIGRSLARLRNIGVFDENNTLTDDGIMFVMVGMARLRDERLIDTDGILTEQGVSELLPVYAAERLGR